MLVANGVCSMRDRGIKSLDRGRRTLGESLSEASKFVVIPRRAIVTAADHAKEKDCVERAAWSLCLGSGAMTVDAREYFVVTHAKKAVTIERRVAKEGSKRMVEVGNFASFLLGPKDRAELLERLAGAS